MSADTKAFSAVLRDAELLVELCSLERPKIGNADNLADMASDGWRAAVRELLLPVATRLRDNLWTIATDTEGK